MPTLKPSADITLVTINMNGLKWKKKATKEVDFHANRQRRSNSINVDTTNIPELSGTSITLRAASVIIGAAVVVGRERGVQPCPSAGSIEFANCCT